MTDQITDASPAFRQAEDLRRRGESDAALLAAWAAFDSAPADPAVRRLLAQLLAACPDALNEGRRADYLSLLTDPAIEPDLIGAAGWMLLLRTGLVLDSEDVDALSAATAFLDTDDLALALLEQSPVGHAPAERLASTVRRWLLLSGRWRDHPRLVGALKAQTGLNYGAWPFDDTERAQLGQPGGAAMLGAYVAPSPAAAPRGVGVFSNTVTSAVAAQYEGWPYPAWTRITRPRPRLFRETSPTRGPAAQRSASPT